VKTEPPVYEIRVRGHLDPKRLHWFECLTVRQAPDGQTLLVGPIPDQAALFGLLSWLYDLGIPLLSVKQLVIQNEETEK
jgi:hypothetical protein